MSEIFRFQMCSEIFRVDSEIFCVDSENQLSWYLHAAVVCCVVPILLFLHIHSNYTDCI
jgi:hypothetical protein